MSPFFPGRVAEMSSLLQRWRHIAQEKCGAAASKFTASEVGLRRVASPEEVRKFNR